MTNFVRSEVTFTLTSPSWVDPETVQLAVQEMFMLAERQLPFPGRTSDINVKRVEDGSGKLKPLPSVQR